MIRGKKSGKLLAWRIRTIQTNRAINSIFLEHGEKIVDPLEINSIFKLYYKNLYKSENTNNLEGQNYFLDKFQIPRIIRGDKT